MSDIEETVETSAKIGDATYNVELADSNMEQIRNTVRALRKEPEVLEHLEDPVKVARRQKDWEEFKEIVADMIEEIHTKDEEVYEHLLKNAIDKFALVVLSDVMEHDYQKKILKRVLTSK